MIYDIKVDSPDSSRDECAALTTTATVTAAVTVFQMDSLENVYKARC